MRNARLDEAQAGIKIARRLIFFNKKKKDRQEKYEQPQIRNDTTLLAGSEEELKSPLMKVKEECEKAGLMLNIQKTKIMASSPITSWHRDGETMTIVTDFIFLGYKITVDGDCSHEIKRLLFLGRKAMTNLHSIKSRDITLPRKVRIVKALISLLVRYGCKSWT